MHRCTLQEKVCLHWCNHCHVHTQRPIFCPMLLNPLCYSLGNQTVCIE